MTSQGLLDVGGPAAGSSDLCCHLWLLPPPQSPRVVCEHGKAPREGSRPLSYPASSPLQ